MSIVNKLKKVLAERENRAVLIGPYKGFTAAERRAARTLQGFSNSELADIGLARGGIRDAVRNGREGIDTTPAKRAA